MTAEWERVNESLDYIYGAFRSWSEIMNFSPAYKDNLNTHFKTIREAASERDRMKRQRDALYTAWTENEPSNAAYEACKEIEAEISKIMGEKT